MRFLTTEEKQFIKDTQEHGKLIGDLMIRKRTLVNPEDYTPEDFFLLLDHYDWWWMYSDSGNTLRHGGEDQEKIKKILALRKYFPIYKNIYDYFRHGRFEKDVECEQKEMLAESMHKLLKPSRPEPDKDFFGLSVTTKLYLSNLNVSFEDVALLVLFQRARLILERQFFCFDKTYNLRTKYSPMYISLNRGKETVKRSFITLALNAEQEKAVETIYSLFPRIIEISQKQDSYGVLYHRGYNGPFVDVYYPAIEENHTGTGVISLGTSREGVPSIRIGNFYMAVDRRSPWKRLENFKKYNSRSECKEFVRKMLEDYFSSLAECQ